MSTPEEAGEEQELERLRGRIAELEREAEEHRRAEQRFQEAEERFHALTEVTREMVGISVNGILLDVNGRLCDELGYASTEVIGKPILQFMAPEVHEDVLHKVKSGFAQVYESICLRKDGTRFPAEIFGRAIRYQGRVARVTTLVNLTVRKLAEQATRDLIAKEEVLRAQAAVLAELSTPLLPISAGVVVLPLVGAVGARRAQQVIETLVSGVAAHRASLAILDITGVPTVDTQVADALLGAARAVRLLGAEVVLTGVRPEVAQTFVTLGTDLREVITHGTLERGIAYALSRKSIAIGGPRRA